VEEQDLPGATQPLGSQDQFENDPDAVLYREIARYVEEALPRFALHGSVRAGAGIVRLDSSQGCMEVDLGTLVARWNSLDEASRRDRAIHVVRQLAAQRSPGSIPPPNSGWSFQNFPVWPIALVAAAGALGLFLTRTGAFQLERPDESPRPPLAARDQSESADARARRVCEATKARVARGTTINVADTDGWVIELSALRPTGVPSYQAALAPFFGPDLNPGRFIWPEEPNLGGGSRDLSRSARGRLFSGGRTE
jgi:hypothetical protein